MEAQKGKRKPRPGVTLTHVHLSRALMHENPPFAPVARLPDRPTGYGRTPPLSCPPVRLPDVVTARSRTLRRDARGEAD